MRGHLSPHTCKIQCMLKMLYQTVYCNTDDLRKRKMLAAYVIHWFSACYMYKHILEMSKMFKYNQQIHVYVPDHTYCNTGAKSALVPNCMIPL